MISKLAYAAPLDPVAIPEEPKRATMCVTLIVTGAAPCTGDLAVSTAEE